MILFYLIESVNVTQILLSDRIYYFTLYRILVLNSFEHFNNKSWTQAGADMCQAPFKLGLAKSVLHSKQLRPSSMNLDIEVVFHLQKNISCRPCTTRIKVVFHLQKNLGCLPVTKYLVFAFNSQIKLMLSSIYTKLRSSSTYKRNWGSYPITVKLRWSS